MSRWLDSFREARAEVETPVPIAPIAPIGANQDAVGSNQNAIGTTGTIGTGIETAEPSPPWDATAWQTYFHERAAIREYDGELPRNAAERQAFADTVDHWLVHHPPEPTDDAAGCVHCGAALGDDGVPVLAGGAHTWLHSACHPPWLVERRRHAAEALAAMGVEVVGTHG